MKLIHTSDWHLGMTYRGGNYGEDQRFFIEKICEIALKEQAEGIIIAGDVFDKSIAAAEAVALYDEAMTRICVDLGLKVYLVAGNHDGAERLSQCNALLRKSGLFIAGALEAEPIVINEGDTDLYLLPWISTDKVKSIFPNEAEQITSLERAYELVLDKYRAAFVPGHRNILVSHSFVVGAETSTSDRSAEVGTATMIGSYVFKGFDYVALGHIHGPQIIGPEGNIRYSGTPMAYSFGKEEAQVKSVTVIDTNTMECKTVPVPALHKRTTLKGSFEDILAANYPQEILDGYVRLEIEDRYAGLEAISVLRDKYRGLIEVSSRSYDNEDSRITMTIEELESFAADPEVLFERYCQDVLGGEVPKRLCDMFTSALKQYEEEAD